MIYILLANGASVIPQFLPAVAQSLLLLWALRVLMTQRFKPSLPITGVAVALMLLMVGAVLTNETDEGLRFAKLLINALVAALVAAGIERRYALCFGDVYTQAMLVMTLVGIAGLLLATLTPWHLTSAIGDRTYHTNLLTTWLRDGGFESSQTLFSPLPYRLQTMFDEPGTYGILLVPAFFHAVHRNRAWQAALLLTGAFLSESANAWLLCGLILAVKACTVRSASAKLSLVLALLAALVAAWSTLVQLYEVKTGLDEAYAANSSLSVRQAEYEYVRKAWLEHLLPLQNRQALAQFPDGISVAYVSWYINAGLLLPIMLLPIMLALVAQMLRSRLQLDPDRYFALALATTLLLSGFQRSSFLDNVLFMSLTFWAVIHRPPRMPSEAKA
jgi:hypothetical protein